MTEGHVIADSHSVEIEPRFVVELDDEAARDPALTGGKSAALARAAAAELATLPGVVLTTAFSNAVDGGAEVASHPAVKEAFELAGGDQRSLVARSSSVVEDMAESSMAGQFDSIIGIDGFDGFVTAVRGGPEPLVSGEVDGSRFVLDPSTGKVLDFDANDGPKLERDDLKHLVALSAQVASVFGGPQDVEWAIATDKKLWLLQSRPVTTEVRGVPRGPIYGPGPVAETFPSPLTELENDLWVPPLREAVCEAVVLSGTATLAQVHASGVVICVDGHVAIDLRLAGEIKPKHRMVHKLNPIPAARQLRGAWRVGRLRSALPQLAEHPPPPTDAHLEAVPPPTHPTSRQLIALLHRSRDILRALHAHEILMGMLTDTGGNRMTGASVALRVLAEARQDGLSDKEIVARSPSVLALTGPQVAPSPVLPEEAMTLHIPT